MTTSIYIRDPSYISYKSDQLSCSSFIGADCCKKIRNSALEEEKNGMISCAITKFRDLLSPIAIITVSDSTVVTL